jgi:hypothetical protein
MAYTDAVRMRKVLLCGIYDKIGKLSMKSLMETNSGKLITLISSDFFSIERGITSCYYILTAPILNLLAYLFIGFTAGYEYALITFAFWIFQSIC